LPRNGQDCHVGGEDDVTICDLTGTGAQDTAIAAYALPKSKEARVGSIVAT
jgi:ornithine cyclodeaminase